MEHVLELYRLPYDPRYPVVCMDEASKQLIGEVRIPLPVAEGQPARYDSEYERLGVCNQFMFVEPLRGWRRVFVRQRRTMIDWALCIREILNVHYPEAQKVRLVLDNLNTHTGASLYEAFPPAEARRLLSRLEFHYTPKHGSWLNMAEIEIGVMNGQCLNRRIAEATDHFRRSCRLGAATKQGGSQDSVDLHRFRCTRKTGKNLPINRDLTRY